MVADAFMGVGDRADAALELFRDRGAAAKPLLFYFGAEHREHFHAVAKARLGSRHPHTTTTN